MSSIEATNVDENVSNNVYENPQLFQKTHANVFNTLFGFADTLVVKSALELRKADIIHSNDKPMSLSQIASKIESTSSPDLTCLIRLMRLLVRKEFFTVEKSQTETESLYGLTPNSMLLLHDHELSLASFFLALAKPLMVTPWFDINTWVKEGGVPFEKIYGQSFWENTSKDGEFNKLFHKGMVSISHVNLQYILKTYEQGFQNLKGTLLDLGGGVGHTMDAIVKAHPHIQAINFDLPHVVANAPEYPGVTHIGGDMLKEIPKADNIFIKAIFHNWGDKDCVTILKNCRKTIDKDSGKVIIVDMVIQPEGKGLFDDVKLYMDLEMALNLGGKERTEQEWSKLLNEANFSRYNIIDMPFDMLIIIIEAYP